MQTIVAYAPKSDSSRWTNSKAEEPRAPSMKAVSTMMVSRVRLSRLLTRRLVFFCIVLVLPSSSIAGPTERDLLREWANISVFHLDQKERRITAIEVLKGNPLEATEVSKSMKDYLFADFRAKSPQKYATLLVLSSKFGVDKDGMYHRSRYVWGRGGKRVDFRGFGVIDLTELKKLAKEINRSPLE